MAKKPAPKTKNSNNSKKGKGCSLAAMWDMTDPTEASNNLPAGEQKAILADIQVNKDKTKGTAVFFKWQGVDEAEGKTSSQMYKLTDGEGTKAPGLAYLMRDLALLGYEGIKGKNLEKTLKEIVEEEITAIVNVKEKGEYTNVYVQGLPVDEDVDPDEDEDEDEDEDD